MQFLPCILILKDNCSLPLLTQHIQEEVLLRAAGDVDGFTAIAACVRCGCLQQSQGFSHIMNLDAATSNHLSVHKRT